MGPLKSVIAVALSISSLATAFATWAKDEQVTELDSSAAISLSNRAAQAAGLMQGGSFADETVQQGLSQVAEQPHNPPVADYVTMNQLLNAAGPLPKMHEAIEVVTRVEAVSDDALRTIGETLRSRGETETRVEFMAMRRVTAVVPVILEDQNAAGLATAKYRERELNADGTWRQWEVWDWKLEADWQGSFDAGLDGVEASPRALISSSQFGRTAFEFSTPFIAIAGPERRSDGRVVTLLSVFDHHGNALDNERFSHVGNRTSQVVAAVPKEETKEILLVGSTWSDVGSGWPDAAHRLWLLKYDPELMVALWDREIELNRDLAVLKTYDETSHGIVEESLNLPELHLSIEATGAVRSPLGGYLVVGTLWPTPTNDEDPDLPQHSDLFVAEINNDGDIVWARACGGTEDDSGQAIAVSPDGSIILGGTTQSVHSDVDHRTKPLGWVLKLDANGFVIWDTVLQTDGVLAVSAASVPADTSKGTAIVQAMDLSWRLHNLVLDVRNDWRPWWNGEFSWTRGLVNQSVAENRNVFAPNLTCLNIYWRPTDDQLAGTVGSGRRINPMLAITDLRVDALIEEFDEGLPDLPLGFSPGAPSF